jgi:hypothetical protein
MVFRISDFRPGAKNQKARGFGRALLPYLLLGSPSFTSVPKMYGLFMNQ